MSNTSPRVSIIVPTYNRARVVGRALDSILSQTYTDYEILVVDDGSKDDTRAALEPYMDRIRYIHQENQGASAARNRGLQEAQGEIIAFLDSDDAWYPEKLAKQIAHLDQHPEISILACHSRQEIGRHVREDFQNAESQYQLFLWRPFPSNMSRYVVRRECIEKCGLMDVSLHGPEDKEFWLRLMKAGYRFDYLPEPLVIYYVSEDSISLHPNRMLAGEKIICERYVDTIENTWTRRVLRSKFRAKSFWAAALNFHAQGKRGTSCLYLLKSMLANPMWPCTKHRVAVLVLLWARPAALSRWL